ncbi:MAG TPA: hypothetical protein PLG66_01135 [Calditrichia bacterium]|nr:hypothetical protein [Calditrichia bacterium]
MKSLRVLCLLFLVSASAYPAFDNLAGRAPWQLLPVSGLAGFGRGPQFGAALNYARLFNQQDLSYGEGALFFRKRHWGFLLEGEQLNAAIYRETRFATGLLFRWEAGHVLYGKGGFYQIGAEGYRSAGAPGVQVGLRLAVHPHFRVHADLVNFNQPRLNGYPGEIPQVLFLGGAWSPDPAFAVRGIWEKDQRYGMGSIWQVDFRVLPALNLRAGYETTGSLSRGGLTLTSGSLQCCYDVVYHFELGPTHKIGLSYVRE